MNPERGDDPDPSMAEPLFPMTQWSLVQRAQGDSTAALDKLCGKYRRPLLIWLRSRQRDLEGLDPEDLVNGFLGFKLPQQVLKAVTPNKGKFRSFVKTCLKNYVIDELTKRNAAVRGGGIEHQSVNETDEQGQPVVDLLSANAGADEEFDRAWGLALLESAVHKLENELSRKGYLRLWRRLEPLLYKEAEAPGYVELAKEFDMPTAALHKAAYKMRKRLMVLIREEVRETVASPQDFEEELKQFTALFANQRRP